jgi:2-polyprenyl-6-methoxyphenol hydroxylase-like FAD-dependent oxidoreductase
MRERGDAVNLAWKLAGVLHGWGGSGLVASYEAERRPVGERNRNASVENAMVILRYRDLVDGDPHRRGQRGR